MFLLDFGLRRLTSLQFIQYHVAGFYKPTIPQSPPSHLWDYSTCNNAISCMLTDRPLGIPKFSLFFLSSKWYIKDDMPQHASWYVIMPRKTNTVKPVHIVHPWDPLKAAVEVVVIQRVLQKWVYKDSITLQCTKNNKQM